VTDAFPAGGLLPGIVAGFACAFFSAVTYLVSRHHGVLERAEGRRHTGLRLLVLAHMIMAVVCLPLAWLGWPERSPDLRQVWPPLAASTGCYLLGQAAFQTALRRVEASRLSPLLGLKLAMLAGLVTLGFGQPLDQRQWLAVSLCIAAAAVMQSGRGGVPAAPMALMVSACLCFALADIGIVRLIDGLQTGGGPDGEPLGRLEAGGLAMVITYAACGLLFAPLAPGLRPHSRQDWTSAAVYSTTWLLSMVGLYVCFGLVGVIFGNILQSTRGIMSVVLGAGLAHLGWHELEQRVDRATLVRRLAAAALMTAAIALYVIDLS
jgi:drug/metabolite transporter (DMT)-like permease